MIPHRPKGLPRAGDSVLHQLWEDTLGRIGLIGVSLVVLVAVFAPVFARYDVAKMIKGAKLLPPCAQYWFGTDQFGRDVFSRIVYGARVSLLVGLLSVTISAVFGFLFGILAGYFKGKTETVIMMVMDIIFAFPPILLALFIVSVLGSSIVNTMIAIGVVNIPVFTRTVRASVKTVMETEYIKNARCVGVGRCSLIFHHIAPNILAPFFVQATLALSGAILTEAIMSFLGLGIQPPAPSWGSMINESRKYMEGAPWLVVAPAVAISVTILSFNLLGDSLRDILDPKLKM